MKRLETGSQIDGCGYTTGTNVHDIPHTTEPKQTRQVLRELAKHGVSRDGFVIMPCTRLSRGPPSVAPMVMANSRVVTERHLNGRKNMTYSQ